MSTFAERIQEALKDAGISQAELARRCAVRAPSVSDWLSGKTKSLTGMNLLKASQALGVSQEWLGTGKGKKRLDEAADANVGAGPDLHRFRPVPLISWVQAGDWQEVIDTLQPGEGEPLFCPKAHGPHTFALRVRGMSMSPRYDDGDVIFVDPDVPADHGKNVVVRLETEMEATFKQLVIEDGRKFLKALNPDWTPRIMEISANATICGVVIGKWVPE